MNIEIVDYRNGKYQGLTNAHSQRHGLGIFIDDDLTFYISHWDENRLKGPTLIYISHGKYIYGEWKNNQPHGLTVFRSGQTVLVGKFQFGSPTGKCLLIFQRFNLACVLQQQNEEWNIVHSGQLLNHKTLIKFIEMIDVMLPDHYFSLTKFACSFSNSSHSIKTYPCYINCCFFGYHNGLAIVFNSNNGLISIGYHYNDQVCEFGGRFQGSKMAEEGNFEFNQERIQYVGERPTHKIYSIFQKLHKRSLNFYNEYFDPKVKTFTNVEDLLRSKIDEISNEFKNKRGFRNIDLNDSLDYQEYNEQESFKINSIREKMYQMPEKNSKNGQLSPLTTQVNESKEEISVKSPKYFRKNIQPSKDKGKIDNKIQPIPKQQQYSHENQKRQLEKLFSIFKGKQMNTRNFGNETSPLKVDNGKILKNTIKKTISTNPKLSQQILKEGRQQTSQFSQIKQKTPSKLKEKMKSNNLRYITDSQEIKEQIKETNHSRSKPNSIYKESKDKSNQLENKELKSQKTEKQNCKIIFKNNNEQQKQQKQQTDFKSNNKQVYTLGKDTLKNKNQDYQRKEEPIQQKIKRDAIVNSPKPTYEDIQERRKRILKQYRELNGPSNKIVPLSKTLTKNNESPCNNIAISAAKDEGSFGYLPISIYDKAKQKRLTPSKNHNYKYQQKFTVQNQQRVLTEKKQNNELTLLQKYRLNGGNKLHDTNETIFDQIDLKMGKSKTNTINQLPKRCDENNEKVDISSKLINRGTPSRLKKYQYLYE